MVSWWTGNGLGSTLSPPFCSTDWEIFSWLKCILGSQTSLRSSLSPGTWNSTSAPWSLSSHSPCSASVLSTTESCFSTNQKLHMSFRRGKWCLSCKTPLNTSQGKYFIQIQWVTRVGQSGFYFPKVPIDTERFDLGDPPRPLRPLHLHHHQVAALGGELGNCLLIVWGFGDLGVGQSASKYFPKVPTGTERFDLGGAPHHPRPLHRHHHQFAAVGGELWCLLIVYALFLCRSKLNFYGCFGICLSLLWHQI